MKKTFNLQSKGDGLYFLWVKKGKYAFVYTGKDGFNLNGKAFERYQKQANLDFGKEKPPTGLDIGRHKD